MNSRIVSISSIPVIFICPDHNSKYAERKQHMIALLDRLGFQTVYHYRSSTEDYPTCLARATIETLSMHLDDNPVLLLEDDVECTGWEKNVNVPDNADAIYIGISKDGGSSTKNSCDGPSQFQVYNDSLVRVINMLSAHAVIYISKIYKQAVINEMKKILSQKGHYNDVVISRIQKNYNVYAMRKPYFYQSAKFGNVQHVQNQTLFQL